MFLEHVFAMEIGLVLYVAFLLETAVEIAVLLPHHLEEDVIKRRHNVNVTIPIGDLIVKVYYVLVIIVPQPNAILNVVSTEYATILQESALVIRTIRE